jgi:hypothetical protein
VLLAWSSCQSPSGVATLALIASNLACQKATAPMLGAEVGCPEGRLLGRREGCAVGFLVGWPVGLVGYIVGWLEGCRVGCLVGWPVGSVGRFVGCLEGCIVGWPEG